MNGNRFSEFQSDQGKPTWTARLYTHLLAQLKKTLLLFSGSGARGGYLAAIDQGIISAANFLATIILARNVDPTELGVYAVGFTALHMVRAIQDGLIIQPMNAYGAHMGIQRFQRYATSNGILQLLMALLLSGISVLGGWILIRTGNDTAGPAVLALWAPILGGQLQEYLRRLMYTRGAILNATVNTSINNTVRLLILLWWSSGGKLSGVAGLYAISIGAFAAIVPGLWQTRGYWGRKFIDLRLNFTRNWRYGSWIAGGNILNWVSIEFYPVLTAGLISFAAAGAYRAIQNLVAPIHLLLRAIDTYITPRAARAYHELGVKALNRTLRMIYLAAGVPTMILLVLAILFRIQLLQLFYGDKYLAFAPGVVWMVIFYMLLYLYWPLQIVLKAARNSRPIFVASLAAILAMFTVGIWLILRWDVYGTIAGQALNALVTTIVLSIAWSRYKKRESVNRKLV